MLEITDICKVNASVLKSLIYFVASYERSVRLFFFNQFKSSTFEHSDLLFELTLNEIQNLFFFPRFLISDDLE